MERLISDAPGDTRRVLRRIAEGNLGRLQAPEETIQQEAMDICPVSCID